MTKDCADETLATRWAAGDRAAGEELFSRYLAPLLRFMASKVPRSSDASEDLVAKVFMKVVENPQGFRHEGSYRGYLFGIARHVILHWLRERARRPEVTSIGELSLAKLDPSLSSMVARKKRNEAIQAAIFQLPLDLQITLELHYWEHATVAEIAQVLEVPLGTAKTRLRRAKFLLAAALLEYA
jgi:RNA polymerase sigma-70 factor (ECF subfamily)